MMRDNNPPTLVLIDGHALAYRMFFALQNSNMSTRTGEPTEAVYGFTRTVLELITADPPPEYLAVSFDVGATFRDKLFPEYKGTREKMPERLQIQIDRIHEVLDAFNVPILEADGYEADDVLGTVAALSESLGVHTLIVTGDRDLLQLVDEHTTVQLPGGRQGDSQLYDTAAVLERFGVTPSQIVDYKALVGDTSDNIPGVSGVGEKTAVKLIQEYQTLENIYANLDVITAKRTKTALEENRDNAFLSHKLALIVRDVPLDFKLQACKAREYNREKVVDIFRELEFRSLWRMLPGLGEDDAQEVTSQAQAAGQQLSLFRTAAPSVDTGRTQTIIVSDEKTLKEMVDKLNQAEAIAFDTETTGTDQMSADLVGIALSVEPGTGYYIPVGHQVGDSPQLSIDTVLNSIRPALTNAAIPKYGHNIKYDAVMLSRYGVDVRPLSVDSMIGAWLLQPEGSRGKLGLKGQAFIRLGVEMTEITDLIGTGKKQITMDLVPIEQAAPYAAADADMTLQLVHDILPELRTDSDLERLFTEIEMPLIPVLADMEMAGILVDVDLLKQMSVEIEEQIENYLSQVFTTIGYDFNLNSTQQLSDALFNTLQLSTEGLKKTKSGHYSTAAGVLEGLLDADTTGVIQAILEYRTLEKLRSTYLDALPLMVNPKTGRIHTSFNQTGAVTGRLSSSDPNLQNIPIRSEVGRRIRNAFIAAPGHVLIGADYSQVELRILAHMSGDEALKQAFVEGQDIHATTASLVYNTPIEQITTAQRSFAKAVNFGLLYGMGAFRLARDSNMSLSEAEAFIQAYFERFPSIQQYLESTKQQAVEQFFAQTLLGRRRHFYIFEQGGSGGRAEIERRAAEREAVNHPIQGTAADIIKIAMVKLHQALNEQGFKARMLLQVHDELVLEAPESEAEAVQGLVRDVMENAYPLDVPLKVDAHTGKHWGDLK